MNSDLGCHEIKPGLFLVYNFDNHQIHEVRKSRGEFTDCDCHDYQNHCKNLGINCKHILAVENYLNNQKVLDEDDPVLKIIGDLAFLKFSS